MLVYIHFQKWPLQFLWKLYIYISREKFYAERHLPHPFPYKVKRRYNDWHEIEIQWRNQKAKIALSEDEDLIIVTIRLVFVAQAKLIAEARAEVNVLIIWSSTGLAWPIHLFLWIKNVLIFFLKLENLVNLVVDNKSMCMPCTFTERNPFIVQFHLKSTWYTQRLQRPEKRDPH